MTEVPPASGRVLVIDDSPLVAEAVASELTRLNLEVETAVDSTAALELTRRWHPDAVVCDLHMPNVTGFDMLGELHRIDASLPVIFLTSETGISQVLQAVRGGVFDYVIKAPETNALFIAVERAIAHSRLVRENHRLSEDLRRSRDELEARVAARTAELETAVGLLERRGHELESVLAQLQRAQQRLVAQEKMASLGLMSAGVAHEVNNPMTYIIASLDLIKRALPDLETSVGDGPGRKVALSRIADIRERLQQASLGSDRVRQIVRDLQIFARGNDEDVKTGPIDLRAVVEFSINMAWHEIKHRARLAKTYGSIPVIHGNDARLGQVMLNLLINAAQAIPEGERELHEIRIHTHTDAHGNAVIEVHDTGCGMTPDVKDRIFDPFFTTKDVGVGTGLGLSICHGIVRAMGGTIDVESTPRKGSVFRVRLPPAPRKSPELGPKTSGSLNRELGSVDPSV